MGARAVLVGIDSGQTMGKVAVFDTQGAQLASASAPTTTSTPHPQWVERDLDELWSQVALAIRTALGRATEVAGPLEVLGVGVCGHNDGAYAVDEALRPVRPGILATDGRALASASALAAEHAPDLLRLTGQLPYAASPAALYHWLRAQEPEVYHRIRWIMFCKDWIRLRLTGAIATDRTEATASFANFVDGEWSPEALELYGLPELVPCLPPLLGCSEVAGEVTEAAAAETGLPMGTPVITGAHDVDANALGIGAIENGSASVVLGTFSINQVVAGRPVVDRRWQVRPFLAPGQWLHMSTSPAGAGNLDWAIRRLGPLSADGDPDPAAGLASAFAHAADRSPDDLRDGPLFVPFLYGAPHGHTSGAAWYGMRARHGRDDLLLAVVEGVAFNHRTHLDGLRSEFAVQGAVRACGGGSRSAGWTQVLSDVLGMPVEVTDADESGARGAAMLAGVGVGVYEDLAAAVTRCVQVVRRHEPDALRAGHYRERYDQWLRLLAALDDVTADPGGPRTQPSSAEQVSS